MKHHSRSRLLHLNRNSEDFTGTESKETVHSKADFFTGHIIDIAYKLNDFIPFIRLCILILYFSALPFFTQQSSHAIHL